MMMRLVCLTILLLAVVVSNAQKCETIAAQAKDKGCDISSDLTPPKCPAGLMKQYEQLRCASCPEGWANFDGSCYTVIRDTQNWMDAQVSCEMFNGHLATITTSQENSDVASLVAEEVGCIAWIGVNDMVTDGKFRLIKSNDPTTYNSFREGEPNGQGSENCVAIDSNGRWMDWSCSHTHYCFVCETVKQ